MKRKQITTTFREDLLKACKKLAIECDCSVNDILETAYQYLRKNRNDFEISKMAEANKKYREEI